MFGSAVRAYRRVHEISKETFADRTGLSIEQVSWIEGNGFLEAHHAEMLQRRFYSIGLLVATDSVAIMV
ncbi:MAG: helix-turn-helix domain-containing protein [Methylocystis sp.]|uniref:hypothetical protein n=1 Tax=Methylocystis sp. TaxID=1911079 RepID=UPI003924593A